MRRRNRKVAVVAAFAAIWGGAVEAETLTGVYNTGPSDDEDSPGGTLDVEFGPCAEDPAESCGTIVAVRDPDPDAMDDKMPDGSPIIGFVMVRELEDRGGGKYRDGEINAVDESLSKDKMVWYGVKVDALEDGRLKVKGCLSFICPRTFYWTPVTQTAAVADPEGQ